MTAPKSGTAQYAALVAALQHTTPPCADDWRHTADRDVIDQEDLTAMARQCRLPCPLYALCNAYASSARPSGGFWAGRYWGRKERS